MGFHWQRTMWLWRNPDNVTHRQLLSIDQVWRRSTALTLSRWGCRRLADNIWLLAHDNNNNTHPLTQSHQLGTRCFTLAKIRSFSLPHTHSLTRSHQLGIHCFTLATLYSLSLPPTHSLIHSLHTCYTQLITPTSCMCLSNVNGALVAVWYSVGLVIGRLQVWISAGATSHQGLLSLPSLKGR